MTRERVRRAQMVLELIARETPNAIRSQAGAAGLALVEPSNPEWWAADSAKEVQPVFVGDR
jgi:hypothetical protein